MSDLLGGVAGSKLNSEFAGELQLPARSQKGRSCGTIQPTAQYRE